MLRAHDAEITIVLTKDDVGYFSRNPAMGRSQHTPDKIPVRDIHNTLIMPSNPFDIPLVGKGPHCHGHFNPVSHITGGKKTTKPRIQHCTMPNRPPPIQTLNPKPQHTIVVSIFFSVIPLLIPVYPFN